MNNLIKGFIIGIGKILPGVSGALLAILMGVYDKSIDYIINFKRNKKEIPISDRNRCIIINNII